MQKRTELTLIVQFSHASTSHQSTWKRMVSYLQSVFCPCKLSLQPQWHLTAWKDFETLETLLSAGTNSKHSNKPFASVCIFDLLLCHRSFDHKFIGLSLFILKLILTLEKKIPLMQWIGQNIKTFSLPCQNSSTSFLQQQNCHSKLIQSSQMLLLCQYEIHVGNYLVWWHK